MMIISKSCSQSKQVRFITFPFTNREHTRDNSECHQPLVFVPFPTRTIPIPTVRFGSTLHHPNMCANIRDTKSIHPDVVPNSCGWHTSNCPNRSRPPWGHPHSFVCSSSALHVGFSIGYVRNCQSAPIVPVLPSRIKVDPQQSTTQVITIGNERSMIAT